MSDIKTKFDSQDNRNIFEVNNVPEYKKASVIGALLSFDTEINFASRPDYDGVIVSLKPRSEENPNIELKIEALEVESYFKGMTLSPAEIIECNIIVAYQTPRTALISLVDYSNERVNISSLMLLYDEVDDCEQGFPGELGYRDIELNELSKLREIVRPPQDDASLEPDKLGA